jgi:hypothetical protein
MPSTRYALKSGVLGVMVQDTNENAVHVLVVDKKSSFFLPMAVLAPLLMPSSPPKL